MVDTKWFCPGKWHVSRINHTDGALGHYDFPEDGRIKVVDSTIRSALTSEPGAIMSPTKAPRIAQALADIGVREIAFNIGRDSFEGDLGLQALKLVAREGLDVDLNTGASVHPHSSAWKRSIDLGVENGATKIRVGYPPFYYPDFSGTEKPLDALEEALEYARTLGVKIGLGFNMEPNAEAEYVARFLNRGLDTLEQAESILISDPYNCLGPDGMRSLMAFLKKKTGDRAPLTPHVHNMMGFAVMTTIAAVQGGARAVDVVVNGVGAHCGHTSFEETVVGLEVLYGLDTGIELEKLYGLSRLVAECTGMPIPPNKPIVGSNAFLYEHSSMATDVLRLRHEGRELDKPIAAGLVGQQAVAVWGRNTMSVDSIKAKLVDMGLDPKLELADKILARTKELLRERSRYPRYLTEPEMEDLIREEM